MSFAVQIKTILIHKKITLTEIAERTNAHIATLSDKLRRDNLRESDIKEIANAMNCDYELIFIDRETGKKL